VLNNFGPAPDTYTGPESDPLVSRRLPDAPAFYLDFHFAPEDVALLTRAGFRLPALDARGDVRLTFEALNEAIYLLDRAAEEGDPEAAELATYLLLGCDAVYGDLC
jgi:hypothetical protein